MIDEPADPLGQDSREVWARNLKRWIKRYLVLDIAGAKRKPQANGGVIFEIPSVPTSTGISGGWQFTKPKIYDKTKNYSGGSGAGRDVVYMNKGNAAVLAGAMDADTGLLVQSKPGIYVCVQDAVPVVNPPGKPAGTYYHLPQESMPTDDNPDAAKVYWVMLRGNIVCFP